MRAYLLVALITALVTFFSTWGVRLIAKKYKIHPAIRDRDVHKQPIPRIGGVAMLLGLVAGLYAAGSFGWFESIFVDPAPILAILGAGGLIVLVAYSTTSLSSTGRPKWVVRWPLLGFWLPQACR